MKENILKSLAAYYFFQAALAERTVDSTTLASFALGDLLCFVYRRAATHCRDAQHRQAEELVELARLCHEATPAALAVRFFFF